MLKELFEWVAREAGMIHEVETDQGMFYNRQLHRPSDPVPTPIRCHSLTGVIDAVAWLGERAAGASLQVRDHGNVYVLSPHTDQDQTSHTLVHAECFNDFEGYERWFTPEHFRIWAVGNFVYDDHLQALIRAISKVQSFSNSDLEDDGISQTFQARKGVSLVENAGVDPIQKLRPFRTFSEVDQPASEFLFRMRESRGSGVEMALMTIEDNSWRNAVMKDIVDYFQSAEDFHLPVIG